MKRSEFEVELRQVQTVNSLEANAARNRLLSWFDGVQRELGYLGALRLALSTATNNEVALQVELDKALTELEFLRGKVAADRARRLSEEDE